jgi:phytoene/squalene synthetase
MSVTPESHSARYFALLYSPASQRLVLEALFGIEREIFESLRPGLDHHVAHSRLQWWREECERTAVGRPVHPLTRALVDAVNGAPSSASASASPAAAKRHRKDPPVELRSGPPLRYAVPAPRKPGVAVHGHPLGVSGEPMAGVQPSGLHPLPQLAGLCGLVDVAVWDLAGATFETRRELTAYCERWSAAMIEPLAVAPPKATDAPAPSDMRVTNWSNLGAAMREIEMLCHLAREAHYGRLRVPLDELESAKADPGVLAKPPWPAAVVELLRARHQSLRDEITRALGEVDRVQQPELRGLLVWAALARRSSQRTERALPDRLHLGRFDAVADAWFAWRIARRATIGRFSLN